MSAGSAPRRADAEAVVRSGDRKLSRAALFERASRAASGLAATGLLEGGTVAVLLRNDLPFLECMLASATAGAYCVPINWHYTTEEVAYILARRSPRPTACVRRRPGSWTASRHGMNGCSSGRSGREPRPRCAAA
jgi:acyl-CoA synthetase (AMP-forming)/AMP-acid ligase II